ncbi:sigma 54-interacting transcriptional regulator [Desulfocurvus sp. DL9XJH121]
MERVLVAAREEVEVSALAKCFGGGAGFRSARDRRALEAALHAGQYDLAFVDLRFLEGGHTAESGDFRAMLQRLWSNNPHIVVVILVEQERVRDAVRVVKAGADNYLTKPIDPVEARYVVDSVREAQRLQTEVDYFRSASGVGDDLEVVGTRSRVMRTVFEKARLAAPTVSTVLLTGETGTGKGVLARLIHTLSNRKSGPFVSVHCGAIPDTLIESELFGHEKGAFTGAVKRKLGRFEIASGGTIFLDEVATVTPPAQIKLLQVLQEKTFQRVGGDAAIAMNARVIAATNVDLQEMCARGEFRQDLYYRLNVFPIEIPSLKERPEDIPLLAEAFLKRLARLNSKDICDIHPTVLAAFARYDWPGNVRELENLMERAFILETSRVLTPESFPTELFKRGNGAAPVPLDLSQSLAEFRERAKENAERHYLKEVLALCKGRVNRSAEKAGVTTRQLHKLMTRHGLRKEDFK